MENFFRVGPAILALVALGACGGGTNPVTGSGTATTISNPNLLPGTSAPTPAVTITRYEAKDGTGNGYAQNITYNSTADTFSVDNLAFDGSNTYQKDTVLSALGPFSVYENNNAFIDPQTGATINQFNHKAIHAISTSGNTEFSIVRTGAYTGYGFGGFLYQRNSGVTLPTTGQAHYAGNYAGLRDFQGRGGLEYAVGTMSLDIDFSDFNNPSGHNGAVKASITGRRVYDGIGTDITNQILTAMSTNTGVTISALPILHFTVAPGALDANGEITGALTSSLPNSSSGIDPFETGKYYAVIAGNTAGNMADEVTGIVVVTAVDPRYSSVTVRETGGFILSRP